VAHGLIDGLRKAGVPRLIVVGGAGSLRDGEILHMDSPKFNAA
jgi:putative NADH-flavin reductase